MTASQPIQILLVEDNPGDMRLATEAFKDACVESHFSWVRDGEEALAFLRREGRHRSAPRPDILLLDLKLPKKDGHQFLVEFRADISLPQIPVVVLTTSMADEDRLRMARLQVEAYHQKPMDLEAFVHIARNVDGVWRKSASNRNAARSDSPFSPPPPP